MKKINVLLGVLLTIVAFGQVSAQVTTGVDLYSSYIWRGAKFGTGPAVQPWLDVTAGGFSIGAWGSVNTGGWDGTYATNDDGTADIDENGILKYTNPEAFEMDLYLGYSFDFGLGITVTDYYFGGEWFDFGGNHFIEPSISFEVGDFSILGAYMFGPDTGDAYVEAGYSIGDVGLFVGAGNGQYTSDGGFMLCNVGVSTSKEIPITEKFSLPVSGSVILNPSTQGFFIAVGISL
ncbi:MAG: hypothetical protein JW798_15390 [Prolixibacteraceae bacterium]|nr:hypothetical protein [Prolixibacteraceae bacterium]